jgi:RNA polymerase sigma factor (sigma-70 family)
MSLLDSSLNETGFHLGNSSGNQILSGTPFALTTHRLCGMGMLPRARLTAGSRQEKAMVTNPDLTDDAHQGRGGSVVADLVTRATNGDKQAWDGLVERYAPLIWSICRRHGLGDADAEDVGQSIWLKLVDQLDKVRVPAALPGWLATTTRRECGRVLRAAREPRAGYALVGEVLPDQRVATAEQELLAAERHAALREASADLPPDCQRLIALLTADPAVPYAEISARLGIPVGSIGPTRRRCLDKLRRHRAIAALIDAEVGTSAAAFRAGDALAPDRGVS